LDCEEAFAFGLIVETASEVRYHRRVGECRGSSAAVVSRDGIACRVSVRAISGKHNVLQQPTRERFYGRCQLLIESSSRDAGLIIRSSRVRKLSRDPRAV